MGDKLRQFLESSGGPGGGRGRHSPAAAGRRRLFSDLKPLGGAQGPGGDRAAAPEAGPCAGARLFLMPAQEIRIGGRQSNATYQYTLKGDEQGDLRVWSRQAARR